MRELTDIFRWSVSKRKILFEEEEWCIYRRSRVVRDGEVLVMIHRCEQADYSHAMQRPRIQIDKCFGCGEPTPDDIKTLYILSTWDQL